MLLDITPYLEYIIAQYAEPEPRDSDTFNGFILRLLCLWAWSNISFLIDAWRVIFALCIPTDISIIHHLCRGYKAKIKASLF